MASRDWAWEEYRVVLNEADNICRDLLRKTWMTGNRSASRDYRASTMESCSGEVGIPNEILKDRTNAPNSNNCGSLLSRPGPRTMPAYLKWDSFICSMRNATRLEGGGDTTWDGTRSNPQLHSNLDVTTLSTGYIRSLVAIVLAHRRCEMVCTTCRDMSYL